MIAEEIKNWMIILCLKKWKNNTRNVDKLKTFALFINK
jgi:hypothetical protein